MAIMGTAEDKHRARHRARRPWPLARLHEACRSALVVFVALCRLSAGKGRIGVSHDMLEAETGIERRNTLSTALGVLEGAGWISRTHKFVNGKTLLLVQLRLKPSALLESACSGTGPRIHEKRRYEAKSTYRRKTPTCTLTHISAENAARLPYRKGATARPPDSGRALAPDHPSDDAFKSAFNLSDSALSTILAFWIVQNGKNRQQVFDMLAQTQGGRTHVVERTTSNSDTAAGA